LPHSYRPFRPESFDSFLAITSPIGAHANDQKQFLAMSAPKRPDASRVSAKQSSTMKKWKMGAVGFKGAGPVVQCALGICNGFSIPVIAGFGLVSGTDLTPKQVSCIWTTACSFLAWWACFGLRPFQSFPRIHGATVTG
jgi:hypothetical protein